ncbi:unnamed protein product [Anisakis simplex]|uniref:Zf-CCHH domain-containing protein n=1 Tax=Anisakis simplex TaxID=6269 RepID=A0A0M3JWX9_ANISI|nr:unnamed protein product [Anisakis simplex]
MSWRLKFELSHPVVQKYLLQMASALPKCKFGARCYRRKYPKHMAAFSHDGIVFPDDPTPAADLSDQAESNDKTDGEPEPTKRSKMEMSSLTFEELKADIGAKFLVSFTSELFRFWGNVLVIGDNMGVENTCEVFDEIKGLRLVGVFDYISRKCEQQRTNTNGVAKDDESYLVKDRFDTDLPNMQTIAIYNEGRFVYWRFSDTPSDAQPLLVHVKRKDKHFPKLEIVGSDDPTHMIAFLKKTFGHDTMPKIDDYLAQLTGFRDMHKKFDVEGYLEKYDGIVKKLRKERSERANGNASHGLGVVVDEKYNDRSKYVQLQPFLDDVVKDKRRLLTLMEYVEESLKEKSSIGMAMEYGQEMFMSNNSLFDEFALTTLCKVYGALKMQVFQTILKEHMKVRRNLLKQIEESA